VSCYLATLVCSKKTKLDILDVLTTGKKAAFDLELISKQATFYLLLYKTFYIKLCKH